MDIEEIEAGHPVVKDFTDEIWATHKRKNSDYSEAGIEDSGDPLSNFHKSKRFSGNPLNGIGTRATDKWERWCNLHAKMMRGDKAAVEDESLEDALLDIAGYAAIYYTELQEQKEEHGVETIAELAEILGDSDE